MKKQKNSVTWNLKIIPFDLTYMNKKLCIVSFFIEYILALSFKNGKKISVGDFKG